MDRARGLPRGAGRHAGQVPGGPARLRARLRPLLLPRDRAGRGARGRPRGRRRRSSAASELDLDALRAQIAAGAARRRRGRDARPRAPGDRRVRAPGRRLRRHRRRRPAHPPRAGPARRAPARPAAGRPAPRGPAARRSSAASRRCCAASSSARQIERTEQLPPSRPLNELDRALPSGPLQDLAAVHRVVAQLKRRLKTQGQEQRGRKRRARTSTCAGRCAPRWSTAACPSCSRRSRVRPRRPEIYVLCDVSTSVTSASRLLPLASCTRCTTRSARCARSCSSSASARSPTSSSKRARLQGGQRGDRAATPASPTSPATPTTGASGRSSATLVEDDLHPRATVIVLGDARTNGRDPRADVFAADRRARPGRTFWLNPEPRLYWNYGDSVIAAYEQHCEAFECWTTRSSRTSSRRSTRPNQPDFRPGCRPTARWRGRLRQDSPVASARRQTVLRRRAVALGGAIVFALLVWVLVGALGGGEDEGPKARGRQGRACAAAARRAHDLSGLRRRRVLRRAPGAAARHAGHRHAARDGSRGSNARRGRMRPAAAASCRRWS